MQILVGAKEEISEKKNEGLIDQSSIINYQLSVNLTDQ